MTRVHVALDLEFTGLDPLRDEIIEIGAVAFQGHREIGRFQTLVRPTIPLPLQTERLTGIRRSDLERAPALSQVRDEFIRFVANHPIVGQNSPRDLEQLQRQGIVLTNPVFDTFDLASILLPYLSSYTLASIAETLEVKVANVHRALADALISKDVFLGLSERAKALDPRTLAEIVQLVSMTEWPVKMFFQDIDRETAQARPATSLAAVLASKGEIDLTNVDFLTRGGERLVVLQPDPDALPPDPEEVIAATQPGGSLQTLLPGYENRDEQVQMLRAVGGAFAGAEHLLVEAGTGTGKSLAYLLPAAALAKKTGQRVVVSTNTINLQEQIVQKDLPVVLDVVDGVSKKTADLKVAVVKGRSNYLCLRRWSEFRRSGIGLSLDEVKVLCRVLVWLPTTTKGDRAELNLGPGEQAVWARVSAQADDCLVGTCTFQKRGTCFLYRARRAAEGAHLVIVNHALLLSDLAANSRILPEYKFLVVDEAHHLEEEATRQFGFSVTRRDVLRHLDAIAEPRGRDRWLGLLSQIPVVLRGAQVPKQTNDAITKLTTELYDRVSECRPTLDAVFDAVTTYAKSGDDADGRKRLTTEQKASEAWRTVAIHWENLLLRLHALGDGLGRLQSQLNALTATRIDGLDDALLELTAQQRRNLELQSQLQAVIVDAEPNTVTWLESIPGGHIALSAAPLEVSELLQEGLFADKSSVVLTSATLAAGDSFEYTRKRLGVGKASELQLGSPFDYENRARVFVPSDREFPEPNRPGYDQAVAMALLNISLAAQGRTLALFTSNSALRRARQAIKPLLEKRGIVVLGQNVDGPRGQLLNAFRTNPRTVLLGTSSFWEGVDIVGDALSALVITKLPFGVPSDPVFAARSEQFKDSFNEFAVPQAILRFRQGFGRLIRSKTDRGVAVILDTRLRTKGYGAVFRRSLPCAVEAVPQAELAARIKAFLDGGEA